MQNPQEHINIFIAYSRKDRSYLERLRISLKQLERIDNLTIWDDGKIVAGNEWEQEIKNHLSSADIVLLLISPDSLASDYFYDEEMSDALKRRQEEGLIVIPIILRPCMWESIPISKMQVLPKGGRAITESENEDKVYLDICRGIQKCIEQVKIEREERIEAEKLRLKELKRQRRLEAKQRREEKARKEEEEKRKREEELKKERLENINAWLALLAMFFWIVATSYTQKEFKLDISNSILRFIAAFFMTIIAIMIPAGIVTMLIEFIYRLKGTKLDEDSLLQGVVIVLFSLGLLIALIISG